MMVGSLQSVHPALLLKRLAHNIAACHGRVAVFVKISRSYSGYRAFIAEPGTPDYARMESGSHYEIAGTYHGAPAIDSLHGDINAAVKELLTRAA